MGVDRRRLDNRWYVLGLRKAFDDSRLALVLRLTKPKSGFVDVPHRAEQKLRWYLESYCNNVIPVLEAHCSSVVPPVFVELYSHVLLWQLNSPA